MEKKERIKVNLGEYGLDELRYAAYSLSGAAHVFLKSAGAGKIAVELSPKSPVAGGFKKRFLGELEDEKRRAGIFRHNLELREFMLLKALSYEEGIAESKDSGLSPEQEKELDALIAQVERELKEESKAASPRDPLGITRTWEENDGSRSRNKTR